MSAGILRVGIAPYPYLNPNCYPSDESGCNVGVELDILHTIATLANLRLELVVTNFLGCGSKDNNGTMTGLMGMLYDEKIDITGNLCGMNKLLSQNVSDDFGFSYPVWQYQDQFVIQALTPPPLSFVPLSPFSRWTWIAYGIALLVFLFCITFKFWTGDSQSDRSFPRHLLKSTLLLTDSIMNFVKDLPAQLIWTPWILWIFSLSLFYNTFILSAILHPFPVGRPFSNGDQLAQALLSGKYKLLSYRNPPPIPDTCQGKKCENDIKSAIAKFGFQFVVNGSGYNLLSAIAEQPTDSSSKFVQVNGSPFVSLYMSEYLENRDRLWLIDNGFENWSVYVWRKNFPHGRKLDYFIRQIGEYKYDGLSKAAGLRFGSQPQTGEMISENSKLESIAVERLIPLFIMYTCGMLIALLVLFLEAGCNRSGVVRRFSR